MGLELAELRLLTALRAVSVPDIKLDVRVVGRRAALRHARQIGGRWIPAANGALPRYAVSRADLVHLMGLDLPPPRDEPFVAMVHDLSSLRYDDEGELPPWTAELVARARLLLTPSMFTAGELVEHLGAPRERIRVVGGAPALDASQARPLNVEELAGLGIEPPYVLRYGGYTKRKNVRLLLEAWAAVPFGTLVLAGPPHAVRAAVLSGSPTLERVVVLDYVPPSLLARLLRGAASLVSTSEYEGFGLPPLEAMASGTPVVAAEAAFVREVCGDAALIVPQTAPAVADALTRVLEDAGLSRRLREAGRRRAAAFGWSQVADRVLGAYRSASAAGAPSEHLRAGGGSSPTAL
jgi:alpha-1,3-rhamnosyl/mannosyltransferase